MNIVLIIILSFFSGISIAIYSIYTAIVKRGQFSWDNRLYKITEIKED